MSKEELQQFALDNNIAKHWVDEMFTLCKEELIEQLLMSIASLQMAVSQIDAKNISNEMEDEDVKRLKMFQWKVDNSVN
jgi:Mn-dependent DtxR family transcriptional regulator